ncbi:MAG TPA: hypothetical protein VMS12_05055 [Thermoanaerobaculia bacterium]|nr:hypothetical protein [Thermoanaerobaculia bacterium]
MSRGQRVIIISAALMIAAAVACGGFAFARELFVVFTYAHQRQVAPSLHEQVAEIRRIAPIGTRFVWLNQHPEQWFSRLWQRLLYPDPVFIVDHGPGSDSVIAGLKRRHSVRFAFSAGAPPIDPGYVWRIQLKPPPGAPGEFWFGELRSEADGPVDGETSTRSTP